MQPPSWRERLSPDRRNPAKSGRFSVFWPSA
ncbi:hypothetical protein GGD62_004221 [Bradyrhizobium sp. ERR14]|nr:hypothetical protein [Bradyrhizobium sp. ERR14]